MSIKMADKAFQKSEFEAFDSSQSANLSQITIKETTTSTNLFISNFLNWSNIFRSFIGTSILSLPYYIFKGGPLVFFMAYFLVLFLLFLSTFQILKLADKKRFKDFEFEKLAHVAVGPKMSTFIETLLFFSQISCYIAGILFTGSLNSRLPPLQPLRGQGLPNLLPLQEHLHSHRNGHLNGPGPDQHHPCLRHHLPAVHRHHVPDQ